MTTIVYTDLPNISQAFSRIDARTTSTTIYIPLDGEFPTFVPHTIEWIAPFSVADNGWELNVVGNGRKVNVKAIGLDVYLDDRKLSFAEVLNLKTLCQRALGL